MQKIIVWGSRGSIPVSGQRFHRYGGSTTCVEIVCEEAKEGTPSRVIIDCGTGLTELGKCWEDRSLEALFLQTHMHWDHIQGFPFFGPLFNPAAQFKLWAVRREGMSLHDVLSKQMTRPNFPVGLDILPASLTFEDIPAEGSAQLGELELVWTELIHPSGSTAYRFNYRGTSVVFTGDVEVQQGCREKLVAFAQGADVMLMDAQYFPEEYESRKGFGHSTPLDAVSVAEEAGVKTLVLNHHDPNHDDDRLDQKCALAQEAAGTSLQVQNAREGQEIEVRRASQTNGTVEHLCASA